MRRSLVSYVALVLAAVLWGYTYLVLNELVQSRPPSQIILIRFAISSVALAIVCRGALVSWWREGRGKRGERLWPYVAPGLLLGMALATQQYGIRITGKPGYAAFMTALIAFFIPLLKRVPQIRARVRSVEPWKRVLPLIAIAAIGVALMVDTKSAGLGDVLLLACAAFYAGQTIAIERVSGTHPAVTFVVQGTVVAVFACAALPLDAATLNWHFTSSELRSLGYLVAFATLVPFLIQPWAQRRVPSEHVGIIYTAIEPLTAMTFAVMAGTEQLTPLKSIGAVMVLASLLASIWLASREPPKAPDTAASPAPRAQTES